MFRMGMPKRNGSFLLFSVFAALDEFEHFFPLNAPAVPDAKRRDFTFMQKPQHCATAHLQNSLTLSQRQHFGIFFQIHSNQPFCVAYCIVLHRRADFYLDTSLSRSTWTAAATAATILMPNSSVFLITFIGSPPLLSTHTAARRSSRERVPGRTAFPRFLPRSSRNPRAPALHQRLRRMPSPR